MLKHHLYLVAFLFSALLLLVGCDNSDYENDTNDLSISELVPNQGRIYNYSPSFSTAIKSKSISVNSLSVSVPSDAIDMSDGYQAWSISAGKSYYVPLGQSFSGQLQFKDGVDYYVEGTLELTSMYGNSSNIYVLDGGTLVMARLQSADVYSAGVLQLDDNFVLNDASITSYSPLSATNLKVENGASIEVSATSSISGKLHLSGASWSSGSANYSNVIFHLCASIGSVQLDNGTSINVESYMDVLGGVNITSGNLLLADKALVSCNLMTVHNTNTNIIGGGSQYAVLDAAKIKLHSNNVETIFYGLLDIHADEVEDNGSGTTLAWAPEIKMGGDTYLEAVDCKPAFGTPTVIEPEYVLKMVASLSAPDDRISATSICFDNGNSYVSWHEKGSPFQGYIDLLTYDAEEDTLMLQSTYYSSETDFNHIYKGGDVIYAAADNFNKGAMVAEVQQMGTSLALSTSVVSGSSANWIEKVGDELYVATGGTEGAFSKYDIDSKNVTTVAEMPYAKSVFEMDEGYGILYNVLEEAKVYNTSTGAEFSVGRIAPENGKNACFSYDNKVYVAKGGSGLGVYSMSGDELGSFAVTSTQGGDAVNCVYVDADYIYLAYGTSGIYLLNHNLEEAYSYKYNADSASANFIRKDGDYIYVSYGLSGVHVLEVVDVK